MTTKKRLLTQNSELRRVGVWNWTIPAHVVDLGDGTRFNCCPNALACGRVCYAKFGTYLFSNVRKRHLENLLMILDKPKEWQIDMAGELAHKRMRPTGIPLDIDHDPQDEWLHGWITRGALPADDRPASVPPPHRGRTQVGLAGLTNVAHDATLKLLGKPWKDGYDDRKCNRMDGSPVPVSGICVPQCW